MSLLREKLSKLDFPYPLSGLCGRRFRLIDGNGDEVFVGTIASIGVSREGHKSWHDCLVITPVGGGWDIIVDLDRSEELDGVEKGLRFTLCPKSAGVSYKLIYTRFELG